MKYVALLRGINVGGNNKVEMGSLKACFEALGFLDVSTYINSGNVIFTTKKTSESKLASGIEQAIEKTFDFPVRTVVRTAANIEKVAKAIPDKWTNDKEQKTDVLFLWDDFDSKDSLKLIVTNAKVDTLKYVDGAIIWHLEKKHYSKSGMKKFIGTPVYKNMTARNANTVRKLAELLQVD